MAKNFGISGNSLLILASALVGFLFLMMKKGKIKRTGSSPKENLNWSIIEESEFGQLRPFIEAQAKHETGNFTSALFKNANNLFGMQKVRKRKNFQNGSIKGEGGKQFGVYSSPNDALKDYLEYLRQWKKKKFPKKIRKLETYIQQLKQRHYFGDSYLNYFNGVKSFL